MLKIKEYPIWVCWNRRDNNKIPINAKTGQPAKSNDRITWSDFETANVAQNQYGGGLGFMFDETLGLCGIDIDIKGDPVKLQESQNILEMFKGTYAEKSPNGGYHIIFTCDISKVPQVEGKLHGDYYQKNPQNGLECYIAKFTNRYFTYTGDAVTSLNITDQTPQLLQFLDKYMKKPIKPPVQKVENARPAITPARMAGGQPLNIDILNIARNAKNGADFIALYDNGDISSCNNDDSSADLTLCNKLAFYCQGNFAEIDALFRQSALYRKKWEREDYRTATINKAIATCREFYTPKKFENTVAMANLPKNETKIDNVGIEEFPKFPNFAGLAKIPPNDKQAEQAILASMLVDNEKIGTALEYLQTGDFYQPQNNAIFAAIIELYNANTPVDSVTLCEKLVSKGLFEQIGGFEYIQEISKTTETTYTSTNAANYAKIVAEKSKARALIKLSTELSEKAYQHENISDLLNQAEKGIFELSTKQANPHKPFVDLMNESIDELNERSKSKSKFTGIETTFIDFDIITAGLQKSDLILIGARPSMGKTAFLLNIAENVAKQRIPTAVFTLEMSERQLTNRILCTHARIDSTAYKTGNLSDEDWDRLVDTMDVFYKYENFPLHIMNTPAINVTALRSACRKLKTEQNLGLIIIDYLQLMTTSSTRKAENRQVEISEISRSLKSLALELDIPIIVAAQLSRAVEQRQNKRPQLSDLRESGAIEQDADIVAFLYRDKYYNAETEEPSVAELIIAKHRNGATGVVKLLFLEQFTKFLNLAR